MKKKKKKKVLINMSMDFKELKELKDKRNEIECLKVKINTKLDLINDSVVYNVFYYILDCIDNTIEINIEMFYSIYDYSEPLYSESKEYVLNNMSFIVKTNLIKCIDDLNDFKSIYSKFIYAMNDFIVSQLSCENDSIDLSDYQYTIKEVEELINNDEIDYLDYLDYLDSIYSFYDSFNDCIDYFMNNYKEYVMSKE